MPITRKLDYVILDMIESSQRTIRTAPLNLGGIPGSGGGIGTPPGGFIGWIPQTRVAYDLSELETLDTPASGQSLLDNLNHMRYRIGVLESGGGAGLITVVDDSGPTSYTDIDTLHFSGGIVVTDLGSGDVRASISQAYLNSVYLRLDTDNNPLIDQLQIINSAAGGGGIYIQTEGDAYTADFEQYSSTEDVSSPLIFGYRQASNSKVNSGTLLDLWEGVATGGTITGNVIRVNSKGNDRLIYNPNIAASGGTSTFIDTNTTMSVAGKLFSLRNAGSEKLSLYGDGVLNIASGATYNVNDVPHTHTPIGIGAQKTVSYSDIYGSYTAWTPSTVYNVGDLRSYGYMYLACIIAHTSTGDILDDFEKWEVIVYIPPTASDTAYDESTWNGVTTIPPSKNAIRDKIYAMDSAIAGKEPADATIVKTGNASWIDLTDGGATTLHTHGGGPVTGSGTVGQVAKWVGSSELGNAALIPPDSNILTLTNAAASTLALNITSAKTLTLTAADNYALTVPATGTAALLATANIFTAIQKINANSTAALLVEQDGVNDNVFVVDTTNARVGVNNAAPAEALDVVGNIKVSGSVIGTGAPQAETNTNDIFRCDSPGGTSAFVGTIATLPGGADLTYNITSGQEAAMVPSSTSQLGKMRLYNTTRGTSALISNCVTGTNTLTLTASVPGGWQTGDTITIASQTVSGGGFDWVDIEITSGPTGKTNLFISFQFVSATNTNALRTHPFETFASSKIGAINAMVANVNNYGFWLQKIVSNVFSLAWTGSPTACTIREAGYLS